MKPLVVTIGAGAAMFAAMLATPAFADVVMRDADIVNLRLGQKVYVDDGSCPSGQIKLITGTKLVENGVQRTRQCVDRKGIKR